MTILTHCRPETKVSNCQHEWAGGIAIRRTSDGHLECGYCRETFVPASKLHQLSEDHSHCEGLLHELGERVYRAENRLEGAEKAWALLDKLLAVPGDHMSACDRIMGATHPCTCGASEARVLSQKIKVAVVETGVSIEKTRPPIAPDEDGDCLRCGIRWDEEELSSAELHECPAGFRDVGE
jgi:hypothetical protein